MSFGITITDTHWACGCPRPDSPVKEMTLGGPCSNPAQHGQIIGQRFIFNDGKDKTTA